MVWMSLVLVIQNTYIFFQTTILLHNKVLAWHWHPYTPQSTYTVQQQFISSPQTTEHIHFCWTVPWWLYTVTNRNDTNTVGKPLTPTHQKGMEIYATEKVCCFLFTINILTHMSPFIHTFLRTTVYTMKWTQQARHSSIVYLQKN